MQIAALQGQGTQVFAFGLLQAVCAISNVAELLLHVTACDGTAVTVGLSVTPVAVTKLVKPV